MVSVTSKDTEPPRMWEKHCRQSHRSSEKDSVMKKFDGTVLALTRADFVNATSTEHLDEQANTNTRG